MTQKVSQATEPGADTYEVPPAPPSATRTEMRTAGKAIRKKVPRESHGAWKPAADRKDPVAILEAQDKDRLPEYIPVRYGRMLASPFAFLRGAAAIMAGDLAGSPDTGITVQMCGDAHLLNFGIFGTQERNLVFGINDFDETLPGPWEWDVKRLAASFVVAGRMYLKNDAKAADAARATVHSYQERIREYAAMGNLELFYSELDSATIMAALTPRLRVRAQALLTKTTERTNIQTFERKAELIDGQYRIIESPPLVVHLPADAHNETLDRAVNQWLVSYRASILNDRRRLFDRYRLVDVVRKVVGVGSVGTRCLALLLRGDDDGDPLFLQVKEAQASVLEPHLGHPHHGNNGRRVVEGQRLIQPAPDVFLGWGRATAVDGLVHDFYVRQLRDMKGSVAPDENDFKAAAFDEYAALCGWALAQAHARSGEAALITGYLGTGTVFDDAVARFGVAYADQTERDLAALAAAERSGRIKVLRGA